MGIELLSDNLTALQALSDTVTGGYCDYIGYCDYLADSRSQMPYFILMPYLIL